MGINEQIRKMALRKTIVLVFVVFICVLILLETVAGLKISDNSVDLLKWVGTSIILGYFGSSTYEHKVDAEKEKMT
jgi:preprotein translocase subunit SecG